MDQECKEHNLEINPLTEIRFRGPFTTVVTSRVQLRNGGTKTLCYKVKTTAPKMYCVRPNSGLIKVGQHVDISIMLQPFDYSASDKIPHKFLIQSVIADENNLENFEQLWKTIDKKLIREIKLKCSFDQDQIFTMNSASVDIEGMSVNIVSTVHDNFFCLLCFNVLKDPYQAPCGCRFCSSCIADYLKTNANVNFCPNKCGEEKMVVWKEHRKMCGNKVVSCPVNILGCSSNNATLTQMSQHIVNNGFGHSEILLKHIDNLNNNLEHSNNEQRSIRNEVSATTKRLKDNQLKELQFLNNKIEAINATVENVELTNVVLSNQIRENIKVGTEIFNQNTLHNSYVDRLQNSIDLMKKEMESMKTKQDSVLEELRNLSIENEDLKKELSEVKNSTEILNRSLPEKIIKLIWKIDDFSTILNLTSPSFYTHLMGYKMDLRLEKKVKGYMSLFACLLHGENDDDLVWPFRKKITIRIVDQESLGRDYDMIIRFDANSGDVSERKYSIAVPTYGFSNFISYKELRSNSYFLKNNRLWIHCFVEELFP